MTGTASSPPTTSRTTAPRSATAWPSPTPSGSRPSCCRMETPATRGWTTTSRRRSRLTGRSRGSREKRDALRSFLTYEATKWQYTHGVKDPELVSPDGPAHGQFLLDRKGNDEIQIDLFLSYGSNPPLYPTEMAGILPRAPAPGPDRLGQERSDLPGRPSRALQARPPVVGIPPARRRALRPGNSWP